MDSPTRHRLHILPALLLIPILGLASRSHLIAPHLPAFLQKSTGDALWSTLLYTCIIFLLPRLTIPRAALATLLISFSVEFSQLYHAPWIDSLRSHLLGHLLLGSGFHPPDFLAYTAGTAIAAALDSLLPTTDC